MSLRSWLAAATLVVLAGCTAPDFAENVTVEERTLTVREIDRENRSFSVAGGGQTFNVRVSDAVVNFDQIEVGDEVTIALRQSVAVGMALPSDTGETVAVSGGALPPVGARPAAIAGELVSAVVTFVAFDPRTNDATVRTQDGRLIITRVQSPELRRFAASRQPGDRIAVELTETVAVAVTPAT